MLVLANRVLENFGAAEEMTIEVEALSAIRAFDDYALAWGATPTGGVTERASGGIATSKSSQLRRGEGGP